LGLLAVSVPLALGLLGVGVPLALGLLAVGALLALGLLSGLDGPLFPHLRLVALALAVLVLPGWPALELLLSLCPLLGGSRLLSGRLLVALALLWPGLSGPGDLPELLAGLVHLFLAVLLLGLGRLLHPLDPFFGHLFCLLCRAVEKFDIVVQALFCQRETLTLSPAAHIETVSEHLGHPFLNIE